jgi:hypothetical protein
MSGLKQYLGDGVYADYDFAGLQIVLTTEDGVHETNRIYLDQATLVSLADYVATLRRSLRQA